MMAPTHSSDADLLPTFRVCHDGRDVRVSEHWISSHRVRASVASLQSGSGIASHAQQYRPTNVRFQRASRSLPRLIAFRCLVGRQAYSGTPSPWKLAIGKYFDWVSNFTAPSEMRRLVQHGRAVRDMWLFHAVNGVKRHNCAEKINTGPIIALGSGGKATFCCCISLPFVALSARAMSQNTGHSFGSGSYPRAVGNDVCRFRVDAILDRVDWGASQYAGPATFFLTGASCS